MEQRLTAAELDAVTRPIDSARGLPNRAYTSADWAAMERDQMLGRTWTCIGFADEVPARHAVPIDLLGAPLVAARDPDETVRVFHNVCRHRGHRLVGGPCALKAGFVCPYHGWMYGFDGALEMTPHIGGARVHEVAGFDKAAHGLFAVRSAVWLGMIFVNLAGDAPEFADFIAPLIGRWAPFTGPNGMDGLVAAAPVAGSDLEVRANWKLAVENFCESYHLPNIHPGLNGYSKMSDHYNIMAGDWGAGQGCTAFDYGARSGIAFPPFPDWPEDKRSHAEYIALFPNVLLGLQLDHVFAMVLRPLAHDRTVEATRLYFIGEAATDTAHENARATLLADWLEIFVEDIGVVEGMQQGRASPAYDGGAFSPFHEEATHHFHGWVARRSAGGPRAIATKVA